MTVKSREESKAAPKIKLRLNINKRLALRCAAATAGAALFFFAQPVVLPLCEALVGQAALFSAAVTMPHGALQSLRERFAGDLAEPDAPLQTGDAAGTAAQPDAAPEAAPPQSAVSSAPAPVLPESAPGKPAATPKEIPQGYRAPLVTLNMGGEAGNPAFLQDGELWLRNYTKLSLDKIRKVLETPSSLALSPAEEGPQVLIYHTHTTESYEEYDNTVYDTRNSWRDNDNTNNMAAVGDLLAAELTAQGISVLHDTEQHDYPSYNGAYDRSRKTVEQYLKEYPTIKVTIDLHRDGIVQADNTVLKPVVEVGGRQAAQLMLIAPCDDGSVGVPGWKENLRFAAALQKSIEQSVPGLCRPVFFCYRNYNLGLTDASLLFELGTNGNTLEEALYTARLIAEPIAAVLRAHTGT